MQIGGLGGSHSTGDHHVTNCIHDHHDVQKDTGGMAMKSSAAMEIQGAKGELQQEGLFSLASWLKDTLGSGRGFLQNFWGDGAVSGGSAGNSSAVVSGAKSSQAVSQAAPPAGDAATATAVMSAQIPMPPDSVNNTGCFSAARDRRNRKQTRWQKIRARLQNESEQLNGRHLKKFFGLQAKNSSRIKREQPEEDLRRSSRNRRDTVEISAARTEDNYLMDSYDCRGEYSRLTTKK